MTGRSVTVIIAVRNSAPTLAAAIESVLAQHVPSPWHLTEVMAIDGGSSDGGDRITRGYSRVRLIHQAGQGLAAALNEAIRAATGEVIAFCDGDDRWTDGSLEVRLAALDADPPAHAAIGKLVLAEVEGAEPTPAQRALIGARRLGFTPGCMVARRSAFDHVGLFDEALRIGADSDWFVRARQSALRMATVEDVVLIKGARSTSLSADVTAYRKELLDVGRRFIRHRRHGDGPGPGRGPMP